MSDRSIERLPERVSGTPRRSLEWLAAAAIAGCIVLFGVASLDRYNVTWDEALGDLYFGERYLWFFATLDGSFIDFRQPAFDPPRDPDLGVSPFWDRPWEYYPVANTLAAAFAEIFGRRLGWVDVFDGFHLFNVVLAALFAVVLVRLTARRWGLAAGVASAGLLFGSPRVVAHMMANVKDFPLMVFFSLTAFAFLRAYERGSVRGLLGAGVLLGLTLGTKANALFFPLIPALVVAFDLTVGKLPTSWVGRRTALFASLFGAGALSVVVLFVVWPYLWLDPVGHALEHFRYIFFRKGFTRDESVAPALEMILWTTPPAVLLAAAAGLVPAVRAARRGDRLALLVLVWPVAVLSRYLLPQAVNFDGVRHFLELFPAVAILGGLGVGWLGSLAAGFLSRWSTALRLALLTAFVVPGTYSTVATHPFQLCYWNAFVGGYGGAREAGLPQASDYWATSYRLGLEWLDEHAEPDSLLAVPVVEHAVRLVASERLRADIQLLPITAPTSPRIPPERLRLLLEAAREKPLYVMFVDRRDWRNVLMLDALRRLEPVAEWRLDDEPVLLVYRYRFPDEVPGASLTAPREAPAAAQP